MFSDKQVNLPSLKFSFSRTEKVGIYEYSNTFYFINVKKAYVVYSSGAVFVSVCFKQIFMVKRDSSYEVFPELSTIPHRLHWGTEYAQLS